ncbi:transposase [Paenarthrobacter nicotinovorans]|nr:transposase [Paenarthrobacter nicotinovorans]
MIYPLVTDLAAHAVPVAVTCRVLGNSQARLLPVEGQPGDGTGLGRCAPGQRCLGHPRGRPGIRVPFYRRRAPVIADELPEKGITAGENRVQRLCKDHGICSVFSKKRGLNRRPGPPVHDDLVERDFAAAAPNELWLTDITEHPTGEGKLYLCAVKDVYSGRIVGYSMDSRMKSSLAVAALENAVRARNPAGTVVHSDRGSQFRSRRFVESLRRHRLTGSAGSVRARTTPRWSHSFRCCRRTSWTVSGGSPGRSCGWRSRPGSSGPTTAGVGSDGWENSRPSNMKQSTGPRSQRPKTPSQQKPGQSRYLEGRSRSRWIFSSRVTIRGSIRRLRTSSVRVRRTPSVPMTCCNTRSKSVLSRPTTRQIKSPSPTTLFTSRTSGIFASPATVASSIA